jgi:hypothetical protein
LTDLEMTKLCAEAIDLALCKQHSQDWPRYFDGSIGDYGADVRYEPLHDDAQAMALVKKFNLGLGRVWQGDKPAGWSVFLHGEQEINWTDLNGAIVQCVARMQAAK